MAHFEQAIDEVDRSGGTTKQPAEGLAEPA